MEAVSLMFETEFQTDVKSNFSLPGISLQVFRSRYIGVYNKIANLSDKLNTELRDGYFGGMNDIYIPEFRVNGVTGTNTEFKVYDVNSLYPYIMKQKLFQGTPMVFRYGCPPLKHINGYVLATVNVPKDIQYPVLIKRDPVRGLIQPTGEWEGIFNTDELKYAILLGVEVKNIEKAWSFAGYSHNFTEYVNDLYELKNNAEDDADRHFYKLMLNSLYGLLGYRGDNKALLITPSDSLDTDEKALSLFQNNLIDSIDNYDDMSMITYYDNNPHDLPKYFSNVAIAAQITSLARVFMHKTVMKLHNLGVNVYYMDTDSIMVDRVLDNSVLGSPDMLGSFKDVYPDKKITDALFLAPKLYGLKFNDGSTSLKASGLKKDAMT